MIELIFHAQHPASCRCDDSQLFGTLTEYFEVVQITDTAVTVTHRHWGIGSAHLSGHGCATSAKGFYRAWPLLMALCDDVSTPCAIDLCAQFDQCRIPVRTMYARRDDPLLWEYAPSRFYTEARRWKARFAFDVWFVIQLILRDTTLFDVLTVISAYMRALAQRDITALLESEFTVPRSLLSCCVIEK